MNLELTNSARPTRNSQGSSCLHISRRGIRGKLCCWLFCRCWWAELRSSHFDGKHLPTKPSFYPPLSFFFSFFFDDLKYGTISNSHYSFPSQKESLNLTPESFPFPCTILRLYSWGWEDGSVHKTINRRGKDLSSNLLHTCKKSQSVTTMPVTPVLGGKDGEILGTHWLVNLAKIVSIWFHERPCLKTIQLRAVEDAQCLPLALTYMCTGTHIQTLV